MNSDSLHSSRDGCRVTSAVGEWPALMAVIVLIYFYVHYAFASLTSHFISLYAPFLAVLLTAGAPAPLAAYAMAFYTNLSASLTHYGTTHSPIVYSAGYISIGLWWKIGLLISFVHLAIWTVVGLGLVAIDRTLVVREPRC